MEPFSPRSANIQFKAKKQAKDMVDEEAKKAEIARKAAKEKEYAPPPPEWVIQPPMPGGVLSEKFRIGKQLGKGGFAICFEGELKIKRKGSPKSVFALKIVRAKMSQKKMEEKFRTELQIHSKMRHPNIVEFYRAFTFGESTYVVLELCSNGSVMDMVKKRRCLSLPEVRRLTVQLCGAIKYMHARNVIHRDLKMGNLFLDHEMNLKIGDFGLAAVLVSKDEVQGLFESAKMRRTTLCGTPNYIAPEILEKGKGGHDHKVDIWAIGVIVFAMLAGQPPFQASSQTEIYRRAKSVEYDWPQEGKHSNYIPEEAKDLVARLLKVDAAERPGPDEVVGHPFFSMHGGNAMPAVMEDSFRYGPPGFLDLKAKPQGDVMVEGTQRLGLRNLAKHCGVGLLKGDMKAQSAVGADTHLSLYTECLVEEQSGQAPIVPLPQNMVYASKFPSTTWPSLEVGVNKGMADTVMVDVPDMDPVRNQQARPTNPDRSRRAPIQSHAASLRASAVVSKTNQAGTATERRSATSGVPRLKEEPVATVRRRRGLLDELPVRPSRVSPTHVDHPSNELVNKPRATRSRRVVVLDEEQERVPGEEDLQNAPTDDMNDKPKPNPGQRHRNAAARSRARIASNVVNEMSREPLRDQKTATDSGTPKSRSNSDDLPPSNALIGPDEVLEFLPHSSPDAVLLRLQDLHRVVETSLTRTIISQSQFTPEIIETKSKNFKHRPVVVKWVDYTNKFGIGYILANGTVGCVFKGDETSSPTCVVVANAESHFKKRNAPGYTDKHQIVPSRGPPIEFIENCGLQGLKRVLVSPSQYQVKVGSSGIADRLGPGLDVFDFEKRKKLCLWEKFGKYMTQTLGRSDGDIDDTNGGQIPTGRGRKTQTIAGPFVKFYQRLGNVGIWGFGDGSFQFNFPDHTKLVISDNGAWLDFYHLPIAAAQALRAGGMLEAGALAERSVLCYPTRVMLSGSYMEHEFGALIRDNELRKKVEFVRDVVAVWAKGGGLGVMGRRKGVKWDGLTEGGGKLVWVTVGAKGGDGRYEVSGISNA